MLNQMPLPRLHLVFRKFKGGELVSEHDEPAHSWTRNAWNALIPMFGSPIDMATNSHGGWGAGSLGAKDMGGSLYTNSAGLGTNLGVAENQNDRGLLLGDSTTAFSVNDNAISTITAWNNVGRMQVSKNVDVANNQMMAEMARSFLNLNDDLSDISVNEVGLVLNGSLFGGSGNFLLARDVLGSTVTVAFDESLEVTYQIIFDATDMLNTTGAQMDTPEVKSALSHVYYGTGEESNAIYCDDPETFSRAASIGESAAIKYLLMGEDGALYADIGGGVHKKDKHSLTTSYIFSSNVASMVFGDGYLFVADGSSTYKVNPSNMSQVNSFASAGNALAYDGTYLYIGGDSTTYKVDPSDMSQVDSFGSAGNILIFGDDGYLYGSEGSVTYKVDPSTMSQVDSYSTGAELLEFGSDHLFVSSGSTIYEVDPSNMSQVDSFQVGSYSNQAMKLGADGYLFVSNTEPYDQYGAEGGVYRVDIATKTQREVVYFTDPHTIEAPAALAFG